MKNSISRRSFLKKSTVAAVAAANASLSGLVSTDEGSEQCLQRVEVTHNTCGGPFDTEGEAGTSARDAGHDGADEVPFYAPLPCLAYVPPRMEPPVPPNPSPVTTDVFEGPDGWYWSKSGFWSYIHCDPA